MNNVENRIVEMTFDNEQFESAVAKTMDTLDKFKEKLNFNGAEKGLDKLGKSAGNYQYSINDIGQSLDTLTNRFSSMGTIGGRILENLTDKAVNFATNGLGKMFGSVTSGGLSRAMNLEQARFQMQGIFKDAEKVHRVIYEDILPELQGTPYSLDQAAVVIGQLGASGIQASEDVRQATRAIAGLAAMSGHGFDEVGRIFSKVAGQGNMMGGELQQLSAYGINAAANISEYFKKVASGEVEASKAVQQHVAEVSEAFSLDEAGIRDAASKRMIYYEDMAAAMDYLYGEHAKKSTEMYTGALEDLKAALARIGAEPAAVGLEVMRNAFNALVPAVDAVNAVLKHFTNATKDVVESADGDKVFGGEMYGSLAKQVQGLGISFANLFVQMDQNGKITRWTAESIEEYKQSLLDMEAAGQKVSKWQKEYANYASEGDAIMNPHMWRIITASTRSFVNVAKALGNVLISVGKGFKKALPKVTLKAIANIAEGIERFTAGLVLSKENMKRLQLVSQAVFTPLGLTIKVVIEFVKALVAILANLYKALKPTINAIFSFISAVSESLIGIGEMAEEFSSTAVGALLKFTKTVVGALVKFLQLDKLFGLIQKGITKLADIFDKVGHATGDFFGNFFENTRKVAKSVSDYLGLEKALGMLRNGFIRLKDGMAQMLHLEEIKAAIQSVFDEIKEFFSSGDLLPKLLENLKSFVDWIKGLGLIEKIVNGVSNAFDRLVRTISNITAGPANKISGWLHKLGKGLSEMFDAFYAGDGQYFKKFFKDIVGSIVPALKTFWNALSNFEKKIKPLLLSLKDLLPTLFGFKTWGDMMAALGRKISSAARAIGEFLGLLADKGADKAVKALDKTKASVDSFVDDKVTKKITAFGAATKGLKNSIGGGLQAVGKVLNDTFKDLDPDTAKKTLATITMFAMAFMYFKKMRRLIQGVEYTLEVLKNFGGFFKSISDAFGIKTINKAIAQTIKMVGFALALLLFATAMKQLSDMPWQQMLLSAAIMGAALLGFYKIFKLIANDKLMDGDQNKRMLSLAATIIAFSTSILIIAQAAEKIGSLSNGDFLKGLGAITGLLVAFTVIFKMLSGLDVKGDAAGSFSKAAFSFIGLAQGMKIMAEAMEMIGFIDNTTLVKGGLAVVALIRMLAVFASAIKADAKVFTASLGMIAVAGALVIVVKALTLMEEAVGNKNFGYALLTVIGFMALMAEFAYIAGDAKKNILLAGLGIALIADALLGFAAAMWIIGAMPLEMWGRGLAAVAVMLAGMIAFATFASGDALKAGAGMMLMAAGILALSSALYVLTALDFFRLLWGLTELAVLAVGAGVAIWALSYAAKGLSKEGVVNIVLMSGALLALSVAISLLAAIPIIPLAIALAALVVALLAIGGAMVLLSGISIGMIAVAGAFALLGVACLMVGAGVFLFVTALAALIPLLLTLAAIDPNTLSAGLDILKLAAEGISDALKAASSGILYFGEACIIAGLGVAVVAIAFAALAVAGILCSLAILALAGSIAVLASVIQTFFGGGLLDSITAGFAGVGERIKSGFLGIFGNVKETVGKGAEEAGSAVGQSISDGAASTLDENQDGMSAKISEFFFGNKESLLSDGALTGTETADSTVDAFSGELLGKSGDLGVSYEDMISELDGGNELAAKLGSEGGSDMVGGLVSSLAGGKDRAASAGASLPNAAGKAVQKGSKEIGKLGKVPGKEYAQNLSASSSQSGKAAKSVVDSARKAAQQQKSWGDIGKDAARGYEKGIRGMIESIADAARALVNRAKAAAKAAQHSNSPSKDYEQYGVWGGEGYANGLKKTGKLVFYAATNMVKQGLSTISETIGEIGNAFDTISDFTPTITPVVDLTKVSEGADAVASAFGSQTIGLGRGIFDSVSSVAMGFQERADENAKLVSNIGKLTDTLDGMTESMNSRALNNYITIDGSSDPEAFADGLINSFRLNARTV